jgi:hypothetical protein
MTTIEFNKTSNIFINTGIVAFYREIDRFKLQKPEYAKNYGKIKNDLQADKLIVKNDRLLELLEEVYYFMGRRVYDTASEEQIEKNENVYYDIKKDNFIRFPKMNTYGLTHLLTNNAQGITREKDNSPKIKQLEKSNPKLCKRIRNYFEKNDLKLLSKVYINEPYTKITRLFLDEQYFLSGDKECPIIGESFKRLKTAKNISPFLSGLSNFNSQLGSSDKRVSMKALLLLRFSPALSMYSYYNCYESFTASFFNSSSLININFLYDDEFFYLKDEMKSMKLPFHRNIKFKNFKFAKKDGKQGEIDSGAGAYSPSEITFLLIYTFFKKKFQTEIDSQKIKPEIDPFEGSPFKNVPITLITFKAEAFASTMRPNFYEEYNNFKFIIRLLYKMENNKNKRIPVRDFWQGLLIELPKYAHKRRFDKSRAHAERQIRQSAISKILNRKTILSDLETLFSKCYLILTSGEYCGYRRYDLLTEFLTIYEPAINLKGINMDKSLQQRAINLGKSIGQSILKYENHSGEIDKSKANAKKSRKYLISLHKARTIEQFRDAIIRIQTKFGISVSNEILENMDCQNFKAIKQYAQIGALNQINTVLSNKKSSQS